MAVLETHPVAVLLRFVHQSLSDWTLSLSQGNHAQTILIVLFLGESVVL